MTLASDAARPRAPAGVAPAGDAAPTTPPEELIEVDLRAILDCTHTAAGAVCLFDSHQELLRLAVEVGLSDEGCRKLRSVRRGGAGTWDMPLHSLLNRRVYLIESAAKNRYVPPLVDEVARVRTVACIPLFDGPAPVGSLILVALAPRTFGEPQIRALEQPVRTLVGHIVAMRSRVAATAPAPAKRGLSSGAQTTAAMTVGPSGPPARGARGAPGRPAPAAAPTGASPVQAAVERARTELERLRGRLGEAEQATAAERARADDLAEQLRTAAARAAAFEAERDVRTGELAGRSAELAALEARATGLQAALDDVRAAEAALRAELAHDREVQAKRDVVLAEREAATRALEARVTELDAAHQRLADHAAALEVARTAGQSEVEARIAGARADAEARLASRLADLEGRSASLAAERDTLRARFADLEAEHTDLRAELDARAGALGAADARATTATEEAVAWQRRSEVADAELAAARGREDALARRVAELEQELEAARHDDAQLRDGIAHIESLIQVGGEGIDLGDVRSFELVELDEASAPDDGVGALVLEEVGAAEAAPAAAAPAAVVGEGLLVLDADTHWREAAPAGVDVTVVAPAERAAGPAPERILVNLAAPHALAALGRLRAAGVGAPAIAVVARPGERRALLVGPIDVAARPLDPDALLAALHGRLGRGTRVVTAGADVDGLISLRQALGRLGVSVSMAWDAKQAADLLALVAPDVAIVDLELPPRDGCALVARLGLAEAVPYTVVVPAPADLAASFAAAMVPELVRATLPAKEILTRVLAAPLAPPRRT